MRGMAIQKNERIVLIGACPQEGFDIEEQELLNRCNKYCSKAGYERLSIDNSFHDLEAYRDYFRKQGYDFEPYLEMDMFLKDYQLTAMEVPEEVTFGYYEGNLEMLHKAVAEVEEEWVQYFNREDKFFCAYIDGKIIAFCILGFDDDCVLADGSNKVGSVGCVGTLPQYREKGIGLNMVARATQILKEAGCDRSFIHYTALDKWYGRLGYKTFMRFEFVKK